MKTKKKKNKGYKKKLPHLQKSIRYYKGATKIMNNNNQSKMASEKYSNIPQQTRRIWRKIVFLMLHNQNCSKWQQRAQLGCWIKDVVLFSMHALNLLRRSQNRFCFIKMLSSWICYVWPVVKLRHTSIFLWQIDIGLMVGNSQVIFEKAESSSLTLVGKFPEDFPKKLC